MPHALGMVSFGGEPATAPEQPITSIDKRIADLADIKEEKPEHFNHSSLVRIEQGRFKGCEALFDTSLSSCERVRVLVPWLDYNQIQTELKVSD